MVEARVRAGLPTEPRPARRSIGRAIVVLSVLLVLAVAASITIGAETLSPVRVLTTVFSGSAGDADTWTLVLDYRIPRTLVGIAVGASLGVAGALMQAYTRNPLADPGILGIGAGSAFVSVLAIGLGWATTTAALVWPSLIGALLAMAAVLVLASTGRGPATPVRMTLAGVALAAVLEGITTAIRLADPDVFEQFRSWSAGSVAGRGITDLGAVVPFIAVGLVLAALLVKPLNAVALGEDVASALGTDVARVRLGTTLSVALLVGGATAVAGPIGFIGLMIPHAVRLLVGNDHIRVIPLSVLAAPCLLLAADTAARVVMPLREAPVGIVTAFLGAPVLIWLIRDKQVNTQ